MAPSVFDKYRIVLLASEGCLNRDHVDLLLLNPASAAGIYPTRMTLGAFCWVIQTERNASHQQNGLKFLTVLS
jgi:hypothetical protein